MNSGDHKDHTCFRPLPSPQSGKAGEKCIQRNFFTLILFLSCLSLFSQEASLPDVISSIAEELAAEASDPEAAATFTDLLFELSEEPVNINSSDASELSRLFFLSGFQVSSLIDYTRSSGKIVSLFEIADIPGFDRQVVTMMAPFISLTDNTKLYVNSPAFRNSILANFSIKPGRRDTSLNGTPLKSLIKYGFTSGNISGGFTAEKDAGEKFIDKRNSLPDFLSANIAYTGKGTIRKVIIGDFGARFGCGTGINTGIRTGLSLTSPLNITVQNTIRPYTSTDENNFFRGAAIQLQSGELNTTVYYSVNNIDASVYSMQDSPFMYIGSLYKTGLHDTHSSLIKKDAVAENSYGVNLSYRLKSFIIGLGYASHRLSLPVIPGIENPADLFDFSGNLDQLITLNYTGVVKKIILSGEATVDNRKKTAFMQGITLRLSDRLTGNLLYRRYEPGFTAFHSNGPGSSSSGDNQNGLLGNFNFEAARFLFISGGAEIVHYPWLRSRCSSPSMASKEELRIKFIPSDRFMAEFMYGRKFSVADGNGDTGLPLEIETTARTIKCSARYSPDDRFTFSARFDYKTISQSGEKGMQLLQDIGYVFRNIPLKLLFRHSVFNTGGWSSAIYTWENDLLYSFSVPALSGRGSRSYVVMAVKLFTMGEFRLKYGITATNAGSDDIKYAEEVKMQFRLRF